MKINIPEPKNITGVIAIIVVLILMLCYCAWGEDEFTVYDADTLMTYSITFHSTDSTELLKLDANGDIYWRGRLVTTDKELVEGLNDIMIEFRCPVCKEKR